MVAIYGLASKEFTPVMVSRIFEELGENAPKRRFTIGINDDLTHLSLDWDQSMTTEPDDEVRALFYGLGSDGTVAELKAALAGTRSNYMKTLAGFAGSMR